MIYMSSSFGSEQYPRLKVSSQKYDIDLQLSLIFRKGSHPLIDFAFHCNPYISIGSGRGVPYDVSTGYYVMGLVSNRFDILCF